VSSMRGAVLPRSSPWAPRLDVASGDRLVIMVISASLVLVPLIRPHLAAFVTPADVVMGAAVVMSVLWLGARMHLVRFPLAVPVALMAGAGALAGMVSAFPKLALIAVAQDLILYGWFLAIVNVCRTAELLEAAIRAWVWSSVVWAGLLVAAVIGGWSGIAGQTVEGGRAELTFDSPNQAGLYFALSLMLMLAARFPRRPRARLFAGAVLGTALVLTSSNAALAGVLIALLVVVVVQVRRGSSGAVGAVVATGVVITLMSASVFAFVHFDVTGAAQRSEISVINNTLGRADRSREGRIGIVDQLRDLYLVGGVVGLGAATTKMTLAAAGDPDPKSAHNDLLASFVERGLIGGVGIILLILSLILIAASIVRPLRRSFSTIVPRPSFLVGGLVVILFASLTHEVLHFRFVWALLALIAALHLWGGANGTEQERGWGSRSGEAAE